MDIRAYIEQKKSIQTNLLNYLDDGTDNDYQELIKLIDDLKISDSRDELKSILQLINAISENHHRTPDFFKKLEQILSNYISQIKQYFSNAEIFAIFSTNKRLLLYFLQNNLISVENLLNLYDFDAAYFYPEIQNSKIDKKRINSIYKHQKDSLKNLNNEEFNRKRLIGENDTTVCELIRNDSIVEFIKYVNQNNLPLEGQISRSIFETNEFLEKPTTLIEYAFFFGSIQIIQYLTSNKVKLTTDVWPYAIHSNNAELIHILEENHIIPTETLFPVRSTYYIPRHSDELDEFSKKKTVYEYDTYKTVLIESIKCHHNNIADYIRENASNGNDFSSFFDDSIDGENFNIDENFNMDSNTDVIFAIFKYFNYSCFPEINDEMIFFYACKYDYLSIVKLFLNKSDFDVNKIIRIFF